MTLDPRMRESARRALGELAESSSPGSLSSTGDEAAPRPGRARTTDRFSSPPTAERDSSVERVAIDVRIDGRVEAVTLLLREGELAWSCTDGSAGREASGPPGSPHVRAALRWLIAGTTGDGARASEPGAHPIQSAPSIDEAADRARRLGAALDDVVTAIARAGIAGRESPSVRDGIDRIATLFTRPPSPLARWIGRLERAMATGDARLVARLLDGAAKASDDLRSTRGGAEARARAAIWQGALGEPDVERVVDRPMVEIARETLDGVQRAAVERRYLVDLGSGEVLCEERSRSEPGPSLGPCPRSLFVGLGEVEPGPAPRRVRILQYTVTLEVGAPELERVRGHALQRTSMLVEAYREAITAWPAFAEPVQVIACASIDEGVLLDAAGDAIPIAHDEDPGAAAALDAATRGGAPDWIAGRLIDADGAVRMVPCSLAIDGRLVRLR